VLGQPISPLEYEDCCPETSVSTNQHSVTSQKSEGYQSRISPFLGPEGPVPYLTELASFTYPEPDEINPDIPPNFFEVHFNIILHCTPKLFRQAYAPKCSVQLSFAHVLKCFPPHFVLLDFITCKYEIQSARRYFTELTLQKSPASPVSRETRCRYRKIYNNFVSCNCTLV
jgi:hypothetical protein